jgi:hypothetical protein
LTALQKIKPIIVFLLIIAVPIIVMVAWRWSQPTWQISARNSLQGVIIDVYKSNAAEPTYTTVLAGQTIITEVTRVNRRELPAELGCTTFHDETIRPGRWTVVVNNAEIDIMERALIVNGTTEIAPNN